MASKRQRQQAGQLQVPGRGVLASINLPDVEKQRLYNQGLTASGPLKMGTPGMTAGAVMAHNAGFYARQQPTMPPPGTYDPTIDIQLGQAQRGYGDLTTDFTRDWGEPGTALSGRMGEDYKSALGRLTQQRDWQTSDFDTQLSRGGQDFASAIANLRRSYDRLGNSQRQSAAAAGVASGGALAQALRKRTENEAWDRKPIEEGWSRLQADIATNRERATTQFDWQTGDLKTNYLRGGEDASLGLARGGRELAQYGIDASRLANYSAGVVTPPATAPLAQLLGTRVPAAPKPAKKPKKTSPSYRPGRR